MIADARSAAARPRGRMAVAWWLATVVAGAGGGVAAAKVADPAVVIDRSPDAARVYVGCPSIAILPGGAYVAAHSWFGPGTSNDVSEIFRSEDRGVTWTHAATLHGQWWSTLFVHRESLFILGVDREYGRIVIRQSADGGHTWTTPGDGTTGRLTAKPGYHGAPVPVITHAGRLWRGFELAGGPAADVPDAERGHSWFGGYNTGLMGDLFIRPRFAWSVLVASVPEDADLLRADAWRISPPLAHPEPACQWIEGNVLVGPDDRLVNVLRTNPRSPIGLPARTSTAAALVEIRADGTLHHDPASGIVPFPGGGAKFTIRHDPRTARYWSLPNVQDDPAAYRSIVALASSADLRDWRIDAVVLRDPDPLRHAWQYLDWQFDGDDIVAVSRTADGEAHAPHDANLFTFHRIRRFRDLGR